MSDIPSGNPQLYSPPDFHGDLQLQAAYEVAEEAHRGETRRNDEPYITHPVLVYRLIDAFGERNPVEAKIQKGVALLHDVLETYESGEDKRKSGSELVGVLRKKLIEKLQQLGGYDAAAKLWLNNVSIGVSQLTNDASMFEGKRTWQVNRTRDMLAQFRPVKVFDQIASIIDGGIGFRPLTVLDERARKMARYQEYTLTAGNETQDLAHLNQLLLKAEKGFALKALDLSRACRDLDDSARKKSHKIHEFCRGVISYFKTSYDLGQQGDFESMRQRHAAFDWEKITSLMEQAKTSRLGYDLPENVIHHDNPSMEKEDWTGNKGVATITLSEGEGKVVGISLYVVPGGDGKNPVNIVKDRLLANLEHAESGKKEWTLLHTGHIGGRTPHLKSEGLEEFKAHGRTAIRHFTMSPPMTLEAFIDICVKSRALGQADAIWADRTKTAERARLNPDLPHH